MNRRCTVLVYVAAILLVMTTIPSLFTLSAEGSSAPTGTAFPHFSGSPDDYPRVQIISAMDGHRGTFTAAESTITGAEVTHSWWQDASNPEKLELVESDGARVVVTIPETLGEYFINVTALSSHGSSYTARRLITVDEGGVYVNTNDHHADWINHMTLYEIDIFDWNRIANDRFVGATNHIDELVELGVTMVWLTPIFEGDGLGY